MTTSLAGSTVRSTASWSWSDRAKRPRKARRTIMVWKDICNSRDGSTQMVTAILPMDRTIWDAQVALDEILEIEGLARVFQSLDQFQPRAVLEDRVDAHAVLRRVVALVRHVFGAKQLVDLAGVEAAIPEPAERLVDDIDLVPFDRDPGPVEEQGERPIARGESDEDEGGEKQPHERRRNFFIRAFPGGPLPEQRGEHEDGNDQVPDQGEDQEEDAQAARLPLSHDRERARTFGDRHVLRHGNGLARGAALRLDLVGEFEDRVAAPALGETAGEVDVVGGNCLSAALAGDGEFGHEEQLLSFRASDQSPQQVIQPGDQGSQLTGPARVELHGLAQV